MPKKRRTRNRNRIYQTPPLGYKAWDVARGLSQAKELARSYPPDMPAVIVKTTTQGNPSIFPYTIYIKELYRGE